MEGIVRMIVSPSLLKKWMENNSFNGTFLYNQITLLIIINIITRKTMFNL